MLSSTISTSTATYKKMQASSGLFMAIYVGMHLANHSFLNVSFDLADSAMMSFRKIYQNGLFEGLFFASLVTHFYSNYHIYQRRTKLSAKQSQKDGKNNKAGGGGTLELKAHRWAGYVLTVLVVVHVVAVRVTPLLHFDNPQDFDYSFAAAAIAFFPFHSFTVYYIVLGMAGGWHLIYGIRAALATMQGKSVIANTNYFPPASESDGCYQSFVHYWRCLDIRKLLHYDGLDGFT